MREEHGRALVPVLAAMPAQGIPPGDIPADSGYAHRGAGARAMPLRAAGARPVQDLHPLDRGPHGTHHGAVIANGNLYCPATPRTLLELGPLARDATPGQVSTHDQIAELARHKPGRTTSGDPGGHQVVCQDVRPYGCASALCMVPASWLRDALGVRGPRSRTRSMPRR